MAAAGEEEREQERPGNLISSNMGYKYGVLDRCLDDNGLDRQIGRCYSYPR